MRAFIFTISMLLLCSLSAQEKYNWRRAIAPASLSLVSGAAWGLHEATQHHWPQFKSTFPNANPQFWNPDESWQRPIYMGYKFDAKHMLASSNQGLMLGAGITIAIGKKRPWWHYAADVGISFAAYSIGNEFTYNWLYK